MLIDMDSKRRAYSPQITPIPFRAERLEPDTRAAPRDRQDGVARGATTLPPGAIIFDAPDAGLFVEWLQTDRPCPPRVNPLGTGRRVEWWYVAEAAPGAFLSVGLKRSMEPGEIEKAALDGTLLKLLRRIEPAVGDSFLVQPGVIHSLGPGLSVVSVRARARAVPQRVDLSRARELRHALSIGDIWLDPMPLATLPSEDAPFRIAIEMLGPEQRVMLMDQNACVAVVAGGGTFGNQPYAGRQCWRINGPLPARAIDPTVLIVAEPQQPNDVRAGLRQIPN